MVIKKPTKTICESLKHDDVFSEDCDLVQ